MVRRSVAPSAAGRGAVQVRKKTSKEEERRTKPLVMMRYRPRRDSMSLLVKRNWTMREFLNRWPRVV